MVHDRNRPPGFRPENGLLRCDRKTPKSWPVKAGRNRQVGGCGAELRSSGPLRGFGPRPAGVCQSAILRTKEETRGERGGFYRNDWTAGCRARTALGHRISKVNDVDGDDHNEHSSRAQASLLRTLTKTSTQAAQFPLHVSLSTTDESLPVPLGQLQTYDRQIARMIVDSILQQRSGRQRRARPG